MPDGAGFDPSREWLGIAAVDLADPFRTLGLSRFAADAATVSAAADRLLERLGEIDPGPFRLAHESLARRIEACRAEALAAVAARPTAPASISAPPPWMTGQGASRGGVPAVAGSPPPVPPPIPAAATNATEYDAAEHEQEPSVPTIRLRRPIHHRSASDSALPAFVSALAVAAAGIAAYVLWPQPGSGAAKPSRQTALVTPSQPPRNDPPTVAPPWPANPPVVPAVAEPVRHPGQPEASAPPPREPDPPTQPDPTPPPRDPEPPTMTEPAPPVAPPQPSPAERARVAAEVDKALRAAHAALRRGEFDTADRQIATADRLAGDDERLADRATHWKQLAVYARQFPNLRDEAMKVAVGDLDVGRTRISVIESTPDIFKYKSAGTIKRIPPADVPRPIVNAIVRNWFAANDQPGNHVYLGCDLILLDPPDIAAAREEWRIAKRGGQNVEFLEPLLDDPIIRDAARQ